MDDKPQTNPDDTTIAAATAPNEDSGSQRHGSDPQNAPDDNATHTAAASGLSRKELENIAQMPYEEARDKLIQAVQALEAGGLNLDQSMRQWEIGEALAQRAQNLLNEVRAKLDAAQEEQKSTAATAGTQSNLD